MRYPSSIRFGKLFAFFAFSILLVFAVGPAGAAPGDGKSPQTAIPFNPVPGATIPGLSNPPFTYGEMNPEAPNEFYVVNTTTGDVWTITFLGNPVTIQNANKLTQVTIQWYWDTTMEAGYVTMTIADGQNVNGPFYYGPYSP
jgi:hypothetical protein